MKPVQMDGLRPEKELIRQNLNLKRNFCLIKPKPKLKLELEMETKLARLNKVANIELNLR